ncbi:MerR family transcriptional regulator [Secundilactobacillus similis]|jgi:DNA-binding transcriptional MerR regulator|uniref:Transcription regulator n=1 Tax=Secundilactobacillus similis DSM 23365 = JCM 2765 TaxID=1423804 RepID=A0A0R2ERK2_9LACO|nr:MerR family transcriptional regulator [Secundilactobacillus similis]KRN18905.1 transcription regulator [Secundilactobacillus similis DSM 23365 = JCM 2765]
MPYSIGQVAEKTGLTSYTLRYYDREGLMPFVHRSPAGRREFTDDDLDFIDLITCLKATGMQLAEIRKFVELAMQGDATLETRLAIFKQQQIAVKKQIAQAEKCLDKLDYKVRFYTAACDAGTEAAVSGNCEIPGAPIVIDESLRVKKSVKQSS